MSCSSNEEQSGLPIASAKSSSFCLWTLFILTKLLLALKINPLLLNCVHWIFNSAFQSQGSMCNFIYVFRIISVSCTNEQRWCWNSHTISRHPWCLLDRINTVYAGWWGCCTAYVNTEEVCREPASIHPGCTVCTVLFDTSGILSVQSPCLCICTSWTAGVSLVLYKCFSSAPRGQQVQTVEFQCWRLKNLACFHLMPFYSQPNNMLCVLEYSSVNTALLCKGKGYVKGSIIYIVGL